MILRFLNFRFPSSTKPKPRIAWEVAGVKELLSNCCHFDAFFCYLGSTSALSAAAKGCTILGLQRGEASQELKKPALFGLIGATLRRFPQTQARKAEFGCCDSAFGLRKCRRSRFLDPAPTPPREKTVRVLGAPATRALMRTRARFTGASE